MAKKSRFRSMKGNPTEDMIRRTEESKKREGGTNKWNDYLKDDFDGEKFIAKEGEHLLDIIPYITGTQDPKLGEGERAYMLDVYVHQKVGINEDSVLCPASNYRGKKCPICEHQAKMKKAGIFSEDEVKALNPKRRALYNVVCYDTAETEAKGVLVWEASYHLTEKEILPIARNRRGGGYIPFADPDKGKSISFFREGAGAATRYKGYTLLDREEEISDEILDAAYCLDELLDIKSYEEIEELFRPTAPELDGSDTPDHDKDEEEDHEYERSRSRKRSSAKKEDEEKEKPSKISRRSARKEESEEEDETEKPTFDKDDEIPDYGQEAPDGEEEENEEEEEEKSRRSSSRRSRRK